MNQIYVINPYKINAVTWVFDDFVRGLEQEPFVCGASEFISSFVPKETISCVITFSADRFPGAETIHKIADEMGGAFYGSQNSKQTLWLCPALLRYFNAPPKAIYFRIDAQEQGALNVQNK